MIIEVTALSNGAHRNQSVTPGIIPDGWIDVPNELEVAAVALLPFVTLTVKDGVLTGISDSPEARAAQAAVDAETVANAPLDTLTQVQLAIAELAEAQAADQTATELALTELAELLTGGVN